MESHNPTVEISRISPESFNLSIQASALHYITARIIACQFIEFSYNLPVDTVLVQTSAINGSHSESICNGSLNWNPANTVVKISSEFEYAIAEDPKIWSGKSANATITNYLPAAGNNLNLEIHYAYLHKIIKYICKKE